MYTEVVEKNKRRMLVEEKGAKKVNLMLYVGNLF
jgi:hypothetical protein